MHLNASKEKQFHLESQILPGIAAYETLQTVMPKDEALVLINGAQAFKDKKYMLSSHPRASLLARAEKSGLFDFRRYRARREGELMET